MNKNLEYLSNYEEKDEIEHILDRPGTYIGSMTTELVRMPLFVPSKNMVQLIDNVEYNAALLKLVDEILSNSIDYHRSAEALFKVTTVDVTVNKNGEVIIRDDGGIIVDKFHKKVKSIGKDGEEKITIVPTDLWLVEKLFGSLRTSNNYRDNIDREGVGQNGLGSKITNVYSTSFEVDTADGNKRCVVAWSNNMRQKAVAQVSKCKEHYTQTHFFIDLARFEMTELSVPLIRLIQSKCMVAAATNPNLTINFTSDVAEGKLNSTWVFDSWKDYVLLYIGQEQKDKLIEFNHKSFVATILVDDKFDYNIAAVNGALCNEGTHIKKVQKQITDAILKHCKANEMELITEKDILNRMCLFVNCTISNPAYESQSKLKLSKKIDNHVLNFTKEFTDSLAESPIMEALKVYYEVKYAEEKKKELNNINKALKSTKADVRKYIASAEQNDMNELWLFEGTSASNGFRKERNLNQSAYLLRGKVANTINLDRGQIMENQELREVIHLLKAQFGKPTDNLRNMPFKKVVIAADMDKDGNHIVGLLVAFFGKFFPEYIKAGLIYRALSPIVIAQNLKTKDKRYFYSYDEYERAKEALSGWNIRHVKGLGGLTDADYHQMLRKQKLIQYFFEDKDLKTINIWFDKQTEQRKNLLMLDEGKAYDDVIEND